MIGKRLTLTTAFILLLTSTLLAQKWEPANGPKGTWVNALAINGSTLFTGTPDDGIFRSTDNGRSWHSTGGSLKGTVRRSHVQALAAIGNNVYAGFQDYGGIVRSTDNGLTWSQVEGVPVDGATDNFADGVSGNFTVDGFAGYGSSVFAQISSRSYLLLRSTDNGVSWTKLSGIGLPITWIRSIEATDGFLFAGLHGQGVYRSTDLGDTWTEVNNGLTDSIVTSLEATGGYLYAATFGGLYRSTDNGDSWLLVNHDTTMPGIESLAASGGTLYAATYGGLFRSSDDGLSWSRVHDRLNMEVINLAASGKRVLAGTDRGVYSILDDGQSADVLYDGLVPTDVNCLTERNGVMYAGTLLGVYRSAENGASWEVMNDSLMADISAVAVNDTMIFASPDDGGGGIFRSPLNKAEWTCFEVLQWGFLKFLVKGSFLFASNNAMYGLGLYRSGDNGVSWDELRNGLPETSHSTLLESNGIIYTGTPYGIYSSTDNGALWSCSWPLSGKEYKTGFISAMAACGSALFAGVSADESGPRTKIIVSKDSGVSWKTAWSSTHDRRMRPEVAALVASGNTVVAGIILHDSISANNMAGEVLTTTDNGASWHAFNEGLPNRDIRALLLHGSTLFAGFSADDWNEGARGLYRLQLEETPVPTNVKLDGATPRRGNALRCATAHGNLRITYTMQSRGVARLNIYSLAGRRIASPVDGIRPAGLHSIYLDNGVLPTGMFVVRFETGSSREERTLVNTR